jgi:hypothetical protein
MMHAANTTKSTGSMGSTGSERVKPAEFIALQGGGGGTRSISVRGSTGSRQDFAAINAAALQGLRELVARPAA